MSERSDSANKRCSVVGAPLAPMYWGNVSTYGFALINSHLRFYLNVIVMRLSFAAESHSERMRWRSHL
jgi:hypothetical protein